MRKWEKHNDAGTETGQSRSWYVNRHWPCYRYRVRKLLLGFDESDHGDGRAVLRRSVGRDETLRAKAGIQTPTRETGYVDLFPAGEVRGGRNKLLGFIVE